MARIVIQAGHCHRRTGAVGTSSPDGFTEQQFTWPTSNRAAELLRGDGHDAAVILADPTSGPNYRGDAFVAVHADGNPSAGVRGASVGFRTPEGKALAHAWKHHYHQLGWPTFRGDNYTAALSGYYGTKAAIAQGNRAACIIEAGFLTNPAEANQLRTAGGQERCAEAIRRAVNALFPPPRPAAGQEDTYMGATIIALYAHWRGTADAAMKDWSGFRWWLRHGESVGEAKMADDLAGALAHEAGFRR
jgi:N-acetylmuramoyl-L-alanine amidase